MDHWAAWLLFGYNATADSKIIKHAHKNKYTTR